MTLAIALKCDDGSVIMCSDSQATSPVHKTFNAKKVYRVKGRSPPCIIAGAGDPGYISVAARAISGIEEELSIGSIEKAVQGIYNRFIDRELLSGRKELGYDLLTAIRDESTQSTELYHVYENGRSERIETGWPGYASIGSGTLWSDWLLSPFRTSFADSDVGLQFGVYAIEAVKEIDPSVGGEIQASRIWRLNKGWRATIPSVDYLSKLSQTVKRRRELLNLCWVISSQEPDFEQDVRKRVANYLKPEAPED